MTEKSNLNHQGGELIRDYYLGIICSYIGASPEQVLSYMGRKRIFLEPKQVLQYAMKNNAEMSFQEVADLTFKKVHCTIISSCKVVENLLATDKKFRARYEKPLQIISKHKLKRCLIIGDIFNLSEEEKAGMGEVENALIKRGRYPVLLTGESGYSTLMRTRLKMLLEVGSVYVLPGYEESTEAKLEYDIATKLNIEIIYHEPDERQVS